MRWIDSEGLPHNRSAFSKTLGILPAEEYPVLSFFINLPLG